MSDNTEANQNAGTTPNPLTRQSRSKRGYVGKETTYAEFTVMSKAHCCVPSCRNNKMKQKTLSFFCIPKAEETKREWIEIVRKETGRSMNVRDTSASLVVLS